MNTSTLAPPLPERMPTLLGSWMLPAGRAITLQPTAPGVLQVTRGSLWVTREGPHCIGPHDSGDRVLTTGAKLQVRAGERLVIEPWGPRPRQAAWFSWDACAGAEAGMRQPLADLRAAGRLAAAALAGLPAGLARAFAAALRRA